jgi:hypothetical protein
MASCEKSFDFSITHYLGKTTKNKIKDVKGMILTLQQLIETIILFS